ncbi:TetR/AcrR family transcriptional regulator [Brevibacillus fortis]|uniref:TetR/AcrR family transcriptional regulator n=1 Tax=Brevibacillus fortis TaxID=2126352 RepID=UPI002E1C3A1B|nr:TetR/AcrR family transcriptional regulator [Brevibacillus fortis]
MDGYKLRTEKKKEQIVKVTFELILAFDANRISIAEVAKKAKVSPVSIYNYFGSKDELIRYTILHVMEKKIEEYEEILREDISFYEKLGKIMFDRGETFKNLETNWIQSFMDDAGMKEYVEEFYETRTIPFFTRLVDEGKKEGCIAQHISLEAILHYIQIFKEALGRPGFFTHTSPSVLRDLDHLLYYGLVGKQ